MKILFPGRHQMLTKFQENYLENIVAQGVGGQPVEQIIFAITSADHHNTRRNPLPLHLRAMAITEFVKDFSVPVKIYPIPDIKTTPKFARYVLKQIFYQSGENLTPENTVLACSTPEIISLFAPLGFANLPIELKDRTKNEYSALRPFEVMESLVSSGPRWRENGSPWRQEAAEASQKIYDWYSIGDELLELFQDLLINEDADITETRNYNLYAEAMDTIVKIKFEDIKPFVVQGKVVDAGCGTGALISLLASEFPESDLIGIEATRKFYDFAKEQEYASPYVFFYRRNLTDQNFKSNSINSFIYSSVLHEVYSYLGEPKLKEVLSKTFDQLAEGGRVIIRDVVGPEQPDKKVFLELSQIDGTYDRFFKFAKDFLPYPIKYSETELEGKKLLELSLRDAYEFMSKKDYVENWASEMHETFGFYSFTSWEKELENTGFKIVTGSHPFKNPYIIENRYKNKVTIYENSANGLTILPYPDTNMILVGEKRHSISL